MQVISLFAGFYASNCYLVRSGEHAVVIDPSVSPEGARAQLGTDLPPIDMLILTHAHFDHMLCLDEWRQQTRAPLAVHEYDADKLGDPQKSCFVLFPSRRDTRFSPPDILLHDGDILPLGEERLTVLHTPGHTSGSICLLGEGCIFTGDTVFAGGDYGRTDLYSGDESALWQSVRRLTELQAGGVMYAGHGPSGDFAREMQYLM